jgi:hypothetical protein
MDILLIMLLIWGYNEQPKDVKEEEPEIVPIQETVVPDNAVECNPSYSDSSSAYSSC